MLISPVKVSLAPFSYSQPFDAHTSFKAFEMDFYYSAVKRSYSWLWYEIKQVRKRKIKIKQATIMVLMSEIRPRKAAWFISVSNLSNVFLGSQNLAVGPIQNISEKYEGLLAKVELSQKQCYQLAQLGVKSDWSEMNMVWKEGIIQPRMETSVQVMSGHALWANRISVQRKTFRARQITWTSILFTP